MCSYKTLAVFRFLLLLFGYFVYIKYNKMVDLINIVFKLFDGVKYYVGFFSVLVYLYSFIRSFTEVVPYFEPRNVTVKKGVDAKEFYDLLTEIGR